MSIGKDSKRVVATFFDLKREYTGIPTRVASSTWAREMAIAKKLLTPPPDTIFMAYSADEIIGCLKAMFMQGADIWSLSIFVKNSYLIDQWIESGDMFQVPEWVIAGSSYGG